MDHVYRTSHTQTNNTCHYKAIFKLTTIDNLPVVLSMKAKVRAENGWYVTDWSKVRNGLDNFIHADSNLTADVTIGPYSRETTKNILHSLGSATATRGGPLSNLDPEQGLYRRRGADEVNQDVNHKRGAEGLAYQKQLILENEENRRQHLNHKVARTRIKAALYEFYRSLEMIKNYKVLNHTGKKEETYIA